MEAEEDMEKVCSEWKMKVGLSREDSLCQSMWIVGINNNNGYP